MNNTATVQDQNVKKVNPEFDREISISRYNCPNEHIKDNLSVVGDSSYICDICHLELSYSVTPLWVLGHDVSTDERTQDEDM